MSQRSEGNLPPMDDVSALVDGELGASEVARACARWRDDPDARETWHTYQLIGDVLRSDDLAVPAERDLSFLNALRARLAEEPVVLAPEPVVEQPQVAAVAAVANGRMPAAARRHWRTPAAVMAGFAVVASVMVVTRLPAGTADNGATVMAGAGRAASPAITLAAAPGASTVPGYEQPAEGQIVLDGALIRDARLDEYLAAHKKFGGSSGPGAPSGFLRNAAATTAR